MHTSLMVQAWSSLALQRQVELAWSLPWHIAAGKAWCSVCLSLKGSALDTDLSEACSQVGFASFLLLPRLASFRCLLSFLQDSIGLEES